MAYQAARYHVLSGGIVAEGIGNLCLSHNLREVNDEGINETDRGEGLARASDQN
jgi:hypothetical protein